MKVKIIKSGRKYWYYNMVGEIFEVEEDNVGTYVISSFTEKQKELIHGGKFEESRLTSRQYGIGILDATPYPTFIDLIEGAIYEG